MFLRILLCLFLSVSCSQEAFSAIQLQSLTRAQTSGFGISDTQYVNNDSGLLTVAPGSSVTSNASVNSHLPAVISATGTASLTTEFGAFHANLSASASSGGSYAQTNTYVHGEWHDVIHITSSTLPQNSLVYLTATLEIERTVTDSGPASYWYINVTGDVNYFEDRTHPSATTITTSILAVVGSTRQIAEYFNVEADTQTVASFAPYSSSDSISLDVGHTVHFYLSAPEGVVITSDSGATYVPQVSAAVPEPASITLWGLGALGYVVAGYRRRKAA